MIWRISFDRSPLSHLPRTAFIPPTDLVPNSQEKNFTINLFIYWFLFSLFVYLFTQFNLTQKII